MKRMIFAAIALVTFGSLAFAHSGGTDSRGCHYDHTTGVYHCH